ncbi:hypothetical protein FRC01_010018 [Tulasnella sp. 417]|nr:hypothetical protein FRC01_010018 [Tulasnella sp. 417]
MMGILAIQVIRYFSTFGYESPGFFSVVVACVVLSMLFSSVPWQAWSSPIINQVSAMVAQLFFAYRCYTLYGRNKLIFGGLLIGTHRYHYLSVSFSGGDLLTATETVTDLAIASMTLWKLGGHGGEAFSPNTSDVIQRLRNLTIEAAVPPAICALFNMTFYVTMVSGESTALIHIFETNDIFIDSPSFETKSGF